MFDGKKFVVGSKQTIRMLEENCISEVYIARDADFYVTRQVEETARAAGIEIIHLDSMKKLGRLCGINVGAAVAGVIK